MYGSRLFRTVAALAMVSVVLPFTGGCGRQTSETPHEEVSSAGERRRPDSANLTLAKALPVLTNVTAFAETPLGRSGRVTRSGFSTNLTLLDGWMEVAHLKGPGLVHRLWSNAETSVRWRFSFDDEAEPRLELGTSELFGGEFPFLPPLAVSAHGGRVSYIPLPYAASLRIEIGGPDPAAVSNAAIQIGYRAYAHDDVVAESFRADLSRRERTILEEVGDAWRNVAAGLRAAGNACGPSQAYRLAPGESRVWLEANGPAILRAFRFRLEFPVETTLAQRAAMLQALVLRFTWDDAAYPSVEAPLGDFFVNAGRSRRFASLPLGFLDGHYICRFPMPFRKAVRAELFNDGNIPLVLHAAAHVDSGNIPPQASNYFHAARQTLVGEDEIFDVLRTDAYRGGGEKLPENNDDAVAEGRRGERGHLAGTMVNFAGLVADAWPMFNGVEELLLHEGTNGVLRGTGLTALLNADGWFPGLFDEPLAGMVETAPIRAQGYRWFLADRVAFQTGMSYRWNFSRIPSLPRSLAATAYWYHAQPQAIRRVPSLPDRLPPHDPLERMAIMSALFELERIGHIDEARDRAIEYDERHPAGTMADFLRVRALGYEKRLYGYEQIAPLYEEILQHVRGTAMGRELQRLQWFHADRQRALLATQINGRFRVYLNGERIEQGDNPTTMVVRPVLLRPGDNEIAVKVIPNKPDAWMSLFLRTYDTNIVSGLDWQFSRKKPSQWPATECPETIWHPVAEARRFPLPRWWRFTPNIFPLLQSGDQLVLPWRGPGWTEPPFEETYFRKRFVLPDDLPIPESVTPPASDDLPASAPDF